MERLEDEVSLSFLLLWTWNMEAETYAYRIKSGWNI
jgi:hypothetical protein